MRALRIPFHALIHLSGMAITLPVLADVVVVVHADSPLRSLTAKQVSDLYLGRVQTLSGDLMPQLLDQPRDSEARGRFFSRLNGMDLSRVNAYWARLQFSGDVRPPVQLADNQAIIDAVRRNRMAIGYVTTTELGTAVRSVLTLRE